MSALSDALNAANVEDWSAREMARRGGDRVSHSQLGKYLKPTHPRPGEDVLQVFSDVFKIPMPKLRSLAALPAGEEQPYEPPVEANRLDSRQRRVVNELIRMLAETKVGEGDVDRDATSIASSRRARSSRLRPAEDVDLAPAARTTPTGGPTRGQQHRKRLEGASEESQK